MKNLKTAWQVARVLIGLGLIAFLVLRMDVTRAWELAAGAKPALLVLAAACYLGLVLSGNTRWLLLLRSRGYRHGGWFLLRVYFASLGLNAVLPTALGGDVLRMAYAAEPGRGEDSVAIVLVDRLMGMLGLLTLTLAAALVLALGGGGPEFAWLSGIGLLALGLGVAAVLVTPVYRFLARLLARVRVLGLGRKVVRVLESIRSFRRRGWALAAAFGLSLLLWVFHVSIWFSLGLAVGSSTGFVQYLAYVPIVALVTMVPVSIGGVGVRENGFTILMARAGMPGDQAGTIALFFLVLTYLYALAGGLVLVFLRRGRRKAAEAGPEPAGD